MARFSWLDDLIAGLGRQSMPRPRSDFYVDPQGVARTQTQDFLQQIASIRQAEDMARGSTLAMRARNAERGFLDELGDADLPAAREFTPRDVARLRTDEARRDARFGPFRPDDLNANAWDWRRTVERNLDEARAAQIASDQARNQFIGTTAGSAGLATALGTATAASIIAARERAAKEQEAANAFLQQRADRNYGWDDAAEAKAKARRELPMIDRDPLAAMVPEMPMKFDLPEAPNMSQSDTAELQNDYDILPGDPITARRRPLPPVRMR